MVFTKVFSPNKNRIKRRSVGKLITKPSTSGATSGNSKITKIKTDSQTSIKVIVRVRPINERESQDNYRQIIKVVDNKMLIFDPKEEQNPFFYRGVQQKGRDLLKKQNKELEFIFNHVFDTYTTNETVFDNTTKDIIIDLLDGYNCSVFAYGATGAGKTHTMLGKDNDPGITYRTMAELFRQINVQRDHRDFNLGVTYLEIYNENVQDLLHKTGPLALREDSRAGVIVANLKIVTINNADELLSLLARGNKNRTQHPTDANQESSRSHAVFQVYVNISNKLDGQVKHVKLSMIDLAGSERASATGCKGARFKEGANINKSLLALGNCINNLADGVKHVPYRDSKLTRLLKDSLGGNCRTVMIANIGPSSLSYEDTYNTLRYANRAKKIKTNIKKNIINCQMHITGYIKLVEEQKKEIDLLKQKILTMENQAIKRNHLPSQTDDDDNDDDNDDNKKDIINNNIKDFSIKLADLYEMKKNLNEKILSLQSSDKILCCRIQYKIAADKRLKNLTNAVDLMNEEPNASGKLRVNKSLLHFKRQRQVVKIQMEQAWNELQIVEHNLIKLNSDINKSGLTDKLADKITIHLTQIEKSRLQLMYEHSRKICCLQQCEMESSDNVTKTMSRVLQQYYVTMMGHKIMTDKMKLDYKQLIKSLEGVKNIKWADNDTADSLEDLYCLTSLSTEELEDPINNNIPIYTASYLDDNFESSTVPSSSTSTSTSSSSTFVNTTVQLSPIKYNETVVIEDTMNSTVTLDSPSTTSTTTATTTTTVKNTNLINDLNNTFNLVDNNNNKTKKRQLSDKNNVILNNKISPKKIKKISPRIKINSKPTTVTVTSTKTTAKTTLNRKENAKNSQKPPSVMSAKSVAILNKLKTEKPKLLSTISSSITSNNNNNNINRTNQTDAGKVLKLKERRAITGAHPYQKLQTKNRPPTTTSTTTTGRVPW